LNKKEDKKENKKEENVINEKKFKEIKKDEIQIKEDENNYKNYIIGEITIKKKDINKNIQIINSFENIDKSRWRIKKEDYYKYENENEIKDNCKIEIDNKEIGFSYFYKFQNEGIHNIKYFFKNNLTKTDFMFYKCSSLTNLNLSIFNTQNVKHMSAMFSGCYALKMKSIITKDSKIINKFKNKW
jgi:surface protein